MVSEKRAFASLFPFESGGPAELVHIWSLKPNNPLSFLDCLRRCGGNEILHWTIEAAASQLHLFRHIEIA